MSSLTELEGLARNMLIVSTTLTGLTVLEYTWNIGFEMRVIWPKVWKSAEVKIFVIARYVGLAGQIFNVWFVNRMASGIKNHPLACRAWYSHQAAIMQCLLMSVELLLMLRVCKMYKNDKYVLGILFLFAVGQCATMIISARIVVPSVSFYPTCMTIVNSHPGRIYVGLSVPPGYDTMEILETRLARTFALISQNHRPRQCTDSYFGDIALAPLDACTHGNRITDDRQPSLPRDALLPLADRLVLDKEKFYLAVQNNRELTEVDLDNLEPLDDPDICPVKPSDSKVVPTEAFIAFGSESGLEMEEDITDETHPALTWRSALLATSPFCILLLNVYHDGTLVHFYLYHETKRDITAQQEHPTSGWDRASMRRCWEFLDTTSRSFAAVIKELDGDLARTICMYYLVLRGLDTIEDDMTIPDEKKQPILRKFHNLTVTPGWNFTENGPGEKDRQLLHEYHTVVEEVNRLAPQYA
ncbi:hypothetical protein AZE42_10525, partial [Rhizopogon vesiculosus]